MDLRYAAALAASPGAVPHVPRRVRVDPGAGGSPWTPLPTPATQATSHGAAALHDIMSAQLAEALSQEEAEKHVGVKLEASSAVAAAATKNVGTSRRAKPKPTRH